MTFGAHAASPLVEVARTLGRRKRLFGSVAVLVITLGIPVVFWLPQSYTAIASVVIPTPTVDPLQAESAADQDRIEDDRLATDSLLLQSRDVAEAVVTRLGIGLSAAPAAPLKQYACDRLHVAFACPQPTSVPPLASRVDGFVSHLKVAPQGSSRLIDVSVTDSSPTEAAAAADAVVEEYQRHALAEHAAGLNRIVGWLDARTSDLRDRWLSAVRAASRFQVEHGLTQGNAAGTALIDNELGQASTSLGDAEARLASAQARADALNRARRGDTSGLMALGNQPLVEQEATTLAGLEALRAQKAAEFGPGHPVLQALNHQVAAAKASLNAATDSAIDAVDTEAAAARAEVAQLEHNLQGFKGQASVQASPEVEYHTLQEEAESARSVYETFLTRQKELAERTAILSPPVVFVSHAEVPTAPSAPHRSRLLAAVAVLALVCAAAMVFLAEHLARGFSDVIRLRAAVPLPLVSVMPVVASRRGGRNLARFMVDEPFSRASEAVRSLAAHVGLATADGEKSQILLISSADAGEGKSTVALWLSSIVAGGDQRVLLIDGDHRRGSIAPRLNGRRTPGLIELLSGTSKLASSIQYDMNTGVDYIAAGAPSSRPFSAAEIARLRSLLAELKQTYALIVIDSPPLLGMSDALVYARLADQTVFVCRWKDTSRIAVVNCVERLRAAGAHLTGLVLSMVDPRAAIAYGGDYGQRDIRDVARLYGSP